MSKLTLEDAISHCLEVAEQNETSAITYKNCKEIKANMYEKLTAEKAENDCRECAEEHRQLAEWLTELKERRENQKSLTEQISSVKRSVKSESSDYLSGYISALSAVEGIIAEMDGGDDND